MQGRIHSIQTMGTLDGPGVRAVVFFQGCPLRCAFCHNPDTWQADAGSLYSPKELFEKLSRIKPYFGKDGGVTLSGGEPLMQPQFAAELLSLCKNAGIHTALDTSGCILSEDAKKAAALADLILLDVKLKTEELYKNYTGGSLSAVLEFLRFLKSQNKPVWVRQVIIPTINDTQQDITDLCKLLAPFSNIEKIELLPFKKLCLGKYKSLGISFRFEHMPEADFKTVSNLQNTVNSLLSSNPG